MISIRTERLVILAVPLDQPSPVLKSKRAVREVLERQARLERAAAGNADADEERALYAQQDLRCHCISPNDLEAVGEVTACWSGERGISYVGYSVLVRYRGLGYATEAVRAVVQWLLTGPDVTAIISETFSDREASIKVMEKAGLSRLEANVGPEIVRYVIAKNGRDADLIEKIVITLVPFRHGGLSYLHYLAGWQWKRGEELVALMMLAAIMVFGGSEFWFAIGLIGLTGYGYYLVRRLLIWWRSPGSETLIQLRDGGMFYASRDGYGDVVPWKTFSFFRLPKRGGLELWNGQEWYWIPPQAFSDGVLERVLQFLAARGIGTD